jgi:hypothetical protein
MRTRRQFLDSQSLFEQPRSRRGSGSECERFVGAREDFDREWDGEVVCGYSVELFAWVRGRYKSPLI